MSKVLARGIEFVSLSLNDFLCYEKARVDLSGEGVVFITGENRDDALSESNGSGKSALIEGLVWGLYGVTCRGLVGDAVIRAKPEPRRQASVAVRFRAGGHQWTVRRARRVGKSSLELWRGKGRIRFQTMRDAQARVEQVLGMDVATFTCTVVYSQDSQEWFAEQTDALQKGVFERVLRLGELVEVGDWAKQLVGDCRDVVDRAVHKEEVAEERVQQLKERLAEAKRGMAEVGKTLKEQEADLKAELNRLGKKREKEQSAAAADEERREAVEEALKGMRELEIAKTSLEKEVRRAERELNKAQAEVEKRLEKIEELKSRASSVSDIVGQPCPFCTRVITAKEADGVWDEMSKQVKRVEAEVDTKLAVSSKEKAEQVINLRKTLEEISTKLSAVEKMEREQQGFRAAQKNIKWLGARIAEVHSRLEDLDVGESKEKFKARCVEVRALLMRALADMKSTTKRMEEFRERLPYLRFWEQGFGRGGLRSFVLDGEMGYFNQRIGYYLSRIVGGALKVEMRTQTELKSGDSRERLSWHVTNRAGGEVWKANSAGERRRMNIAVLLALCDLAHRRSPVSLLALDEVFENLDAVGCKKVSELIAEMGQERKILLISHRDELTDHFPSAGLRVVKKGGVAELEAA